MSDVSFGQYYPANSFAHRMDPRTKLVFLVVYIVGIFLATTFWALGVCALALLTCVLFSRVPFGKILKSIKGILFLLIFTALLNIFFYSPKEGETALWAWQFIEIYRGGLVSAGFLIIRLFLLVMGSSLLTLTTTPVSLTDGIESLLTPLKWIKIPVHDIALIMSIALRFIPILTDETSRIMNAQKARGADFETGGLIKRVRAIVPILIPLLISAFRRADELGDAMDARCYAGSKTRTKYKKLRFTWRDLLGTIFMLAFLGGVIALKIALAPIL
ncbi:MAG: energy-coupling factor transporter transmembrane protein EcfT [Clostridia bacterium]|nr:energy-coupling factor transporter transmembrane protein EcfT [Clostridia bacterium]MBQ8352169.1 energy-coupling factor transporter transmembrane protein EcfT [Clostridia bacterium]